MSGGHLDYFYLQVEDIADQIWQPSITEEKKLAELMRDLAKVLHDYEWWKSGDIGEEDFIKSWKIFSKKWLKNDK